MCDHLLISRPHLMHFMDAGSLPTFLRTSRPPAPGRGSKERAVESYSAAMTVRTKEAAPEKWAMIQMNMATVFQSRVRGTFAENCECFISSAIL